MFATIHDDDGRLLHKVEISEAAMSLVVLHFNPSGMDKVTALKSIGAALITEVIEMKQSRWTSLAITNAEDAVMWSVKAATNKHPQLHKPAHRPKDGRAGDSPASEGSAGETILDRIGKSIFRLGDKLTGRG